MLEMIWRAALALVAASPLGDLESVDLLPERYELVQWLLQALAPRFKQGHGRSRAD